MLNDDDARRATEVVEAVLAHDIRCALTGGLAIDARLREHGRPGERRSLNDIDFVVEDFASIPESLAGAFFQHHVHPDANDGRTLLQLVDQPRAIRVDLFCAIGGSLSRASKLTREIGDLDVLSVEDLVARTTAVVCGRLRRGGTIDVKHAVAFSRLRGLGQPQVLAAAWNDYRQPEIVPNTQPTQPEVHQCIPCRTQVLAETLRLEVEQITGRAATRTPSAIPFIGVSGFSLVRLVWFLVLRGSDVEIAVKPRARATRRARVLAA